MAGCLHYSLMRSYNIEVIAWKISTLSKRTYNISFGSRECLAEKGACVYGKGMIPVVLFLL